jgi:hypothetical protein
MRCPQSGVIQSVSGSRVIASPRIASVACREAFWVHPGRGRPLRSAPLRPLRQRINPADHHGGLRGLLAPGPVPLPNPRTVEPRHRSGTVHREDRGGRHARERPVRDGLTAEKNGAHGTRGDLFLETYRDDQGRPIAVGAVTGHLISRRERGIVQNAGRSSCLFYIAGTRAARHYPAPTCAPAGAAGRTRISAERKRRIS